MQNVLSSERLDEGTPQHDPEDFCVCGSFLSEHDPETGRCLVLVGGVDRCTCLGFRYGTRSRKRRG